MTDAPEARNRGGRPRREEAARRAIAREVEATRAALPAMIARLRETVMSGGPSVSVQAWQELSRLLDRCRDIVEPRPDPEGSPQDAMLAALRELCILGLVGHVEADDLPRPRPGGDASQRQVAAAKLRARLRSKTLPELAAELAARREALDQEGAALKAEIEANEALAARAQALRERLESAELRYLVPHVREEKPAEPPTAE